MEIQEIIDDFMEENEEYKIIDCTTYDECCITVTKGRIHPIIITPTFKEECLQFEIYGHYGCIGSTNADKIKMTGGNQIIVEDEKGNWLFEGFWNQVERAYLFDDGLRLEIKERPRG